MFLAQAQCHELDSGHQMTLSRSWRQPGNKTILRASLKNIYDTNSELGTLRNTCQKLFFKMYIHLKEHPPYYDKSSQRDHTHNRDREGVGIEQVALAPPQTHNGREPYALKSCLQLDEWGHNWDNQCHHNAQDVYKPKVPGLFWLCIGLWATGNPHQWQR